MATKLIFCTNEQKETDHELTVDNNGEIVATCDCDRFVKFPGSSTSSDVETLINDHKESNTLSAEQAAIEEARKESENTIEAIADK